MFDLVVLTRAGLRPAVEALGTRSTHVRQLKQVLESIRITLPGPLAVGLDRSTAQAIWQALSQQRIPALIVPAMGEVWDQRPGPINGRRSPLMRHLTQESHPGLTRRALAAEDHATVQIRRLIDQPLGGDAPTHASTTFGTERPLDSLREHIYTLSASDSWWQRRRAWLAMMDELEAHQGDSEVEPLLLDYLRPRLEEIPPEDRPLTQHHIQKSPPAVSGFAIGECHSARAWDLAIDNAKHLKTLDLTLQGNLYDQNWQWHPDARVQRLGLAGMSRQRSEFMAQAWAGRLNEVTHLDLRGNRDLLGALGECLQMGVMPRLEWLDISSASPRVRDLDTVLQHAERLRTLHADRVKASHPQFMSALARATCPLERLSLREAQLHTDAIEQILGPTSALKSIQHLDLSFNGRLNELNLNFWDVLQVSGLKSLALAGTGMKSDALGMTLRALRAPIETLDIGFNPELTDYGLGFVADAPFAGSLSTLRAVQCGFGALVGQILGQSPGLQALQHLFLDDNTLERHGFEALCAPNAALKLKTLGFGRNNVGEGGLEALFNAPWAGDLVELALWDNGLGPAAARQLAQAPLARIENLYLGCNALGDEGLEALLEAPWLGSLRELHLSGNQIGAKGAELLATCQGIAHLDLLDLSFNDIDEDGARALAQSESLRHVARIEWRGNPVGEGGALMLQRAPFYCPWLWHH